MKQENALYVAIHSLLTSIPAKRHAVKDAQSSFVKIKSVKIVGREDVYNMEVAKHHNYAVNGGLIVHNCCDGTRYCVMGIWNYVKQFLPVKEVEHE